MKERISNIELLRIVSMLMILALHANYMGIGKPTGETIAQHPSQAMIQIFVQAICVIGVDVFVMISGWFGIKPSVRGFCNFLWQVFFIVALSYIVEGIFFGFPISIKDFARCFGLFGGGGWFVASYIGLYVLSPVLNAFIELTSIKQQLITLCAFYLFQTLFGQTGSTAFIVYGYSTFSFIGLYLLSSLIRRSDPKINNRIILLLLIGCVIVDASIYLVTSKYEILGIRDIIFNYINPLVILQASLVLLLFSRIRLGVNKWINHIASSCFAVYLLHVGTPFAIKNYGRAVKYLFDSNSTLGGGDGMCIRVYYMCFHRLYSNRSTSEIHLE